MVRDFDNKSAARQWVWDRLGAEGVARFPFPPHGRIPNFAGAEVAAARLLDSLLDDSEKRVCLWRL
jgi:5-formyltetrahydrofolate cyclo-ligase